MRRIPLRYLQENSITAMDIYNPNGKLLISKGLKIDKDMIELLNRRILIFLWECQRQFSGWIHPAG